MIFYDPILKVKIGKYPVGTKFSSAAIIHKNGSGILELYGEAGDKSGIPCFKCKLHYSLGEEISD